MHNSHTSDQYCVNLVKLCAVSKARSHSTVGSNVFLTIIYYPILVYLQLVWVTRIRAKCLSNALVHRQISHPCKCANFIVSDPNDSHTISTFLPDTLFTLDSSLSWRTPPKRTSVLRVLDRTTRLTYKSLSPVVTWLICICMLCMQTCEALQFVQARPMTLSATQRGQRRQYFAPNPPRVLMPPIDLGFRGQISERALHATDLESKYGSLHNYQSDESTDNRWDSSDESKVGTAGGVIESWPGVGKFDRPVDSPETLNLMGQYPVLHQSQPEQESHYDANGEKNWGAQNSYFDDNYRHPPDYSNIRRPSTQMLRQSNDFQHSTRHDDLSQFGTMNTDPMRLFAPATVNEQVRPYTHDPDRHVRAMTLSGNSYDTTDDAHATVWQQPLDSVPLQMGTHSVPYLWPFSPQHQNTHASAYGAIGNSREIGHSSNYQRMTEDEVQWRMKEYHETRELPSLPPLTDRPVQTQEATHHQSGLRLSGTLAHDRLTQNFQKIAVAWSLTGVETLFDEIDTNRDGVIRIDELRNFLWLHEVAVPH